MAGLMAVCAEAGAASTETANKATSGPIQRFMTAPFSLVRVWTGAQAGSRRGAGFPPFPPFPPVVQCPTPGGRLASNRRVKEHEADLLSEYRPVYATTLLRSVKTRRRFFSS